MSAINHRAENTASAGKDKQLKGKGCLGCLGVLALIPLFWYGGFYARHYAIPTNQLTLELKDDAGHAIAGARMHFTTSTEVILTPIPFGPTYFLHEEKERITNEQGICTLRSGSDHAKLDGVEIDGVKREILDYQELQNGVPTNRNSGGHWCPWTDQKSLEWRIRLKP